MIFHIFPYERCILTYQYLILFVPKKQSLQIESDTFTRMQLEKSLKWTILVETLQVVTSEIKDKQYV